MRIRALFVVVVSMATLAAAVSGGASSADGGAVTFSADVAPIFMERCSSCHRPGEIAPMSLVSYGEARPWAKSIKKAVTAGLMPPWFADPDVGEWANDSSLSDQEIDTIVRWVDGGAKEGDPSLMPPVPEQVVGWLEIGKPALSVGPPFGERPG